MIDWAKGKYAELDGKYPTHTKVLRYLISGGTAAFTNLALLYIFTEFLHIWYIGSAVISFVIAFGVSFVLQKYWTFQDARREGIHRQAVIYFIVAAVNLCLNTSLLYLLVEYTGIHYILSQIIASIVIAIESFFVYQIFIFNKPQTPAL